MILAGAGRTVASYLVEVWSYRFFWMSLVRADLRRRYRRSVLGLGWSLLQPICMTTVLTVVYRNLFKMDLSTFAPLLLTGMAFWNLMSTVILQGCGCIVGAEPYIRQQSIPKAIFPLRTVLTMGFHFLLSLMLAIVFTAIMGGLTNPLPLLSLIPTLVLLFVVGWALATVTGFAHAYFPDTQHLAEVGIQALFFLTPIIYPPSLLEKGGLGWLLRINPMAALLQLVRSPIIYGEAPGLDAYAHALLIAMVPIGIACWLLARLEKRVIFAL